MDVIYKCTCHPIERTVTVPDRVDGSDILVWMNVVNQCLGYDHSARSPRCRAGATEYVKIPLDPAGAGIGVKPTKQ